MKDYKSLYQHFLKGSQDELHFAAHSHHFWPDVTRAAQLQCWDDAARFNDAKWGHIFSTIIPATQGHIAAILELQRPAMIALAPNTHELLTRALSPYLLRPRLRLLTSDSEFHSFSRQLRRWEETHPHLQVTRLRGEDLLTDRRAFLARLTEELPQHDVLFLSQVFFNSGLALSQQEIEAIVAAAPAEMAIFIDGYHGFAALPLSLRNLEGRVFYLGGGYKYAQGGEGVGFMLVPERFEAPVLTGWYAQFAQLSAQKSAVGFSDDGMAFWGATMDPSGWYRFNATWDLFRQQGLTVPAIHQHVCALQEQLLTELSLRDTHLLSTCRLLHDARARLHGHFLTFAAPSESAADGIEKELKNRGVVIDRRGERLRFGIGLYHDRTDVTELLTRL